MAMAISIITLVLALVLLLFDPKGRLSDRIVRLWSKAIIWLSGSHVRMEGAEKLDPNEARLLVANHCSWYDPPALWQNFPGRLRFVLKKELIKVPVIGVYAKWFGHFLLDRSDPREGIRIIERAVVRAQEEHLSAVVFPEGTRSKDGRLGPFKGGSFELALRGNLPVQPVAILGSYAVWPKGCAAPRYAGEILVRIGDPIDTTGLKGGPGRRAIAAQAREALLALGVPDRLDDDSAS